MFGAAEDGSRWAFGATMSLEALGGIEMQLMRRRMLFGLAACPLCAALGSGSASAESAHWAYSGENGPDNWGKLQKESEVCGAGEQQSPIDLTNVVKADIPSIAVNWKPEAFVLENNGHTIQATCSPGSVLMLGPDRYELLQFHFHTPSEHAVEGKRTEMEAHFVHKGPGDRLGVLGVLMVSGGANPALHAIMNAAPPHVGKATLSAAIDPASMLPADPRSIWRYEGSLTTPPCSQTVDWIVLIQTVAVDAVDIATFKATIGENARPIQPRNRRFILKS
jgi:carbonic anhydrase